MAFCPHCGKSVAEQAVKCLSCGGELEAKGKPARFKGTMIMQPAAAPAAPAAVAAPAAPAPVAAPPSVSTPAPASGGVAVPSKVAPSKAKHTMIGTGGAGLGPAMLADFKKAQAATAASAPPPPAGSLPGAPLGAPLGTDDGPRMTDPALADTARDPAKSSMPAPADDADAEQPGLAGDPMAERPIARRERAGQTTARVVHGSSSKTVVLTAVVGVLLIALAGYVAARVMGLL